MDDTLTIILSSTFGILDAQFFPPIELLPTKNYVLGLNIQHHFEYRSLMKCTHKVDFRVPDSICFLLGFTPGLLDPNVTHNSDLPIKILQINCLRVECNITAGAYANGEKVHTIHEFFPSVPPGFKIIEIPRQVIYVPFTVKSINNIELRIVNQDGN